MTKSDSLSRVSVSTWRAPRRAAVRGVNTGSEASARIPNASAFCATACPMRPKPMTPSVLPCNLIMRIVSGTLPHPSFLTELSNSTIRRLNASSSAMT